MLRYFFNSAINRIQIQKFILGFGRIFYLDEYPTGYRTYSARHPDRSDMQPYATENIRSDIRQFNFLYQTTLKLSGQVGYPAQP